MKLAGISTERKDGCILGAGVGAVSCGVKIDCHSSVLPDKSQLFILLFKEDGTVVAFSSLMAANWRR